MPPARFRLFWEVSGAFRAQAALSDPLHSNYPTRKYGVQAARTRNSAYCPSERSHVLRCPSQLCCRSRTDLEKHGERVSTTYSVNKTVFDTIWSMTVSHIASKNAQKCLLRLLCDSGHVVNFRKAARTSAYRPGREEHGTTFAEIPW